MISGIVFFAVICGSSGYAALKFSGERIKPGILDYVYPVTGITVWFFLYAAGFGSVVSGTNFLYETFLVITVSILIPWIRFILSFANSRYVSVISLILTIIPVFAAASLRLLMPCLPL